MLDIGNLCRPSCSYSISVYQSWEHIFLLKMGASFHEQAITYNVLLVLCWISVSSRIYVRKVIIRKTGIDDWLLIFVLIAFTVSIGLNIWMAKLGLGRKDSQIRGENYPEILKVLSSFLCKLISILLPSRTETRGRYHHKLTRCF